MSDAARPVRLQVRRSAGNDTAAGALGWVYRIEPADASPPPPDGSPPAPPEGSPPAAPAAARAAARRLSKVAGPLTLPVGGQGADQARQVQLPPGDYLLRVRMPAGEELVDDFTVPSAAPAPEPIDVSIEASGSPHEWLMEAHAMGAVPSDAALRAISAPRSRDDLQAEARRAGPTAFEAAEARGRLAARVRADWKRHAEASRARMSVIADADALAWVVRASSPDAGDAARSGRPRTDRGWLRFWLGAVAAAEPVHPSGHDEDFSKASIGPWEPGVLEPLPTSLREIFDDGAPVDAGRTYFVLPQDEDFTCVGVLPLPWPRVGDGPEAGVAVPLGLTVRYEQAARFAGEGESRAPSRLRATISPADPDALPLLGYLGSGNFEAAASVIESARDAMARNTRNRFAAAALAYVVSEAVEALGATQAAPRDWSRWVDRLACAHACLPDALIARGWMRLQEASRLERVDGHRSGRAIVEFEAAREDLLEAVRRGMPYYAHGVQTLSEALSLVAGIDGAAARSPAARRTRAARTACRWLSMRVDPREVFTTLLL